jgi:hypothetical protein
VADRRAERTRISSASIKLAGAAPVRNLVLGMAHANLVEKARAFAVGKHDGQEGKRPHEPYIQHIHNVVEL